MFICKIIYRLLLHYYAVSYITGSLADALPGLRHIFREARAFSDITSNECCVSAGKHLFKSNNKNIRKTFTYISLKLLFLTLNSYFTTKIKL